MQQAITQTELRQLADALITRQWKLATAESCTGGWVAKVCTDLPGSSQWFDRGFITYSNQAKSDMLDVSAKLIDDFGAVSEEVASAMVVGALAHSQADVALAITGIAGPSGGSEEKPVGTVCFAFALRGEMAKLITMQLSGDRDQVRTQAVAVALHGVFELVHDK